MKFSFDEIFQRYPELLAFLSHEVEATHDYQITQPAQWTQNLYQAAKIALENRSSRVGEPLASILNTVDFNTRSIELERSMLSLQALYALVNGNYDFFKNTPVLFGRAITEEQFNSLCAYIKTYASGDKVRLLEHEIVLGDLGKIKPLREALSYRFNIIPQDPDQFMTALLEQSDQDLRSVLPGLSKLDEETLHELKKINLGFHYGHFVHTESTERELAKLKEVLQKRGMEYLYLGFLVQCCDVAGAAAQDNGKILLNNTIASTYLEDILPLLGRLKDEEALRVYERYLARRLTAVHLMKTTDIVSKITVSTVLAGAFWTQHQQLRPLSILNADQRLLSRLLCMFRIYDPKKALDLEQAILSLKSDRLFATALQEITEYEADTALQTPTYMPAFLGALLNSNKLREIGLAKNQGAQHLALRVGIVLIADYLKTHQNEVKNGKLNALTPFSFNELAGRVKADFDNVYAEYEHVEAAASAVGESVVGEIQSSTLAQFST